MPFSGSDPPVIIRTDVQKINWGRSLMFRTVCAKVPKSLEPISKVKEIELHPYACSKLRMTEISVLGIM